MYVFDPCTKEETRANALVPQIGSLYIPPHRNNNNIHDQVDHYELLETFISKYERLGRLYISGDFNARTGNSQNEDRMQRNHYHQDAEYVHFEVQARVNKDHVVDVYGRRLLDLCSMTEFLVTNGRLGNDARLGDFTFCSSQGQSTVDYLISSYEYLSHIHNFTILPFGSFSDHAGLHMELHTVARMNSSRTTPHKTSVNKLVWDIECKETFRAVIFAKRQKDKQLS